MRLTRLIFGKTGSPRSLRRGVEEQLKARLSAGGAAGDVACLAVAPMTAIAESWGFSVSALIEGTSLSAADVQRVTGYITWRDYVRYMRNLSDLVGGAEGLRRVGSEVPMAHEMSVAFEVFALLVTPRQLYDLLNRAVGSLMYPTTTNVVEEDSDERVRFVLSLPEHDEDCPEFFHMALGLLEVLPEIRGFPGARVEVEIYDRMARYTVHLRPFSRRDWLLSAPRRARARWSTDRLVGRVSYQQRHLNEALAQLREARALIERQNHELFEQIHQQRETREVLARSEARWRSLADSAPDLIMTLDLQGRLLSTNRPSWFAGSEGMSVDELVAPASRRAVADTLRRVVAQRSPSRTLDVEAVDLRGRSRYYTCTVGPMMEEGRAVACTVVARDVTVERQEAARAAHLQRRMRETQKLESLGLLAGGVAHDFNNVLAAISGHAELIEMALPEGSTAHANVDHILRATGRAAGLVRQMLSYAGRHTGEWQRVDLGALVAETEGLLRAALSRGVDLELDVAEGLPEILGDPSQLQQILVNLITNAAAAVDEGGRIQVVLERFAVVEGQEEENLLVDPVEPGPYVRLVVSDDGCGMDEATRARIFEPFFSTRGDSRGLGLASVLGVARGHRAALQLWSVPGEGSRFRVLFPGVEA